MSHFLSQLAQVLKLIFYYSKSTNTSQDEIAEVCPASPRDEDGEWSPSQKICCVVTNAASQESLKAKEGLWQMSDLLPAR